jgi:hypothetical protein
MSRLDSQVSTHGDDVTAALDTFHKALTKRWRTEAVENVSTGNPVLTNITAHGGEPQWSNTSGRGPNWDDETRSAHAWHLSNDRCQYVAWLEGGAFGTLSATAEYPDVPNAPEGFRCEMGEIFSWIENWAWEERVHAFDQVELFDTNSIAALEAAHEDLLGIGARLGLEAEKGSDVDVHAVLGRGRALIDESDDIVDKVAQIEATKDEKEASPFWAGWTGLAAAAARTGFFSSVAPTRANQGTIVGWLATLYAYRATIVKATRENTLTAINAATKALDATVAGATDLSGFWKGVQTGGKVVSAIGTLSGPGKAVIGPVGAVVTLAGVYGEFFLSKMPYEYQEFDITEVVTRLHKEFKRTTNELADSEAEYVDAVRAARNAINEVHRYNVELYDLTANNGEGDNRSSGFEATIPTIMAISKTCYGLSGDHSGLLRSMSGLAGYDRHLTGSDGAKTAGDLALLDLRDEVEEFLKTTSARYYLAGEQTYEAARDYARTDEERQATFDEIDSGWRGDPTREDLGRYDKDNKPDFNAEREADETKDKGYDADDVDNDYVIDRAA